MGINDCYKICHHLIDRAYKRTKEKFYRSKCKIYIDGLSVWFLGYLDDLPNRANAHTKFNAIMSMIRKKNNFTVISTIMYFHGNPPALKDKPVSKHVSTKELLIWCNELLRRESVNEISFLDSGEAESECFFERDEGYASIIVTNDSDILPICYKYQPQSPDDLVFCFLTRKRIFYNTNFLTTKLNKNAFTLLLNLHGSLELIEPLFTFTMTKLMFDILEYDVPIFSKVFQRINFFMEELNEDNIELCIAYFIWLLVQAKIVGYGNFSWPTKESKIVTLNYIQVLEWLIMYSNQGKNVENYDKNFRVETSVRAFYYILRICENVFTELKNVEIENFKQLENIVKEISVDSIIFD
ncbi:GSCOCT00014057001.2-RA-CDS [Cotesia congregata]|uniref:Cc_fen1_2 n=1 Tax=Cotesia congregata TaxID=51543 RepID=A0A8J2HE16_COTCN|nr:GSCOCT00014057001.2-RA-CDS [Cotesia congregata]CAG5095876.1 Cc_fen1_2 [Cotesia congregata]